MFSVRFGTSDPCKDLLAKIIETINKLAQKATEQIQNECKLWEISQNMPVGNRPFFCQFGNWTWRGHQDQMNSIKRTLRRAIRAFTGSGPNGCPDENNNIKDTANRWAYLNTDALLPHDEAERRGISQPLPPVLSSDLLAPICPLETSPISVLGYTLCIPILIVVFG